MLDYPAIAAVAAVVRVGSFEGAASHLGVTQSAVSQRVKGLEERLGVPLVVRGAPCSPTPAGERLLAHFDQVALLEHEVAADIPGAAAGATSEQVALRIAVNSDSLGTWLPAAAAQFAVENYATLDLVLDDEAHTASRLRAGEVLAAVTTTGQPVQGCRIIHLGSLRYVATASPGYVERHFPDGISANAISSAPMLRFDRRDDLQQRWVKAAFGETIEAPTHWVPSTQGFLDMTLAGLGWSLTPQLLAAPLIVAGRLVDLDARVRVDVPLYWQHLRITSRLLADLTTAVRSVAKAALVQD